MKQKNRFSIILEMLMQTVSLKHNTLANALTYDVSYISKWLGGQLPSAKNEKKHHAKHCPLRGHPRLP